MLTTIFIDSLILEAAADEEPEAAVTKENDEEEKPEEKENDSEPDKPADGAADAVHDNGGNELSETHTVKDTVFPESAADADTADKESELTGGTDGEGSSTEENENEESSGGETADITDESGRGDGERESDGHKRGSSEVAETKGERETEREGETGTKSEPQTEPESETSSETGTEDRPESVNRQDNDYYIRTLVETLEEMGFGTEDETETGTTETETETETEMETSVMHEDLQQLHTDLQVICCFIVVFFIISLCSYIYRFFKIFF